MRTERGSELPTYVAKWTAQDVKELLIVAATSTLNKTGSGQNANLYWQPVGEPVEDGYGGYTLNLVGLKNAKS